MRMFLLKSFIIVVGLITFPTFVFAQQTSINLDEHRQEHSLSCEIATLKMALSAHDISVPESELISYLAFDSTPKSSGVWGDPNKGFVGSIDGQMLVDGYGVYWDPIAAVGKKYAQTEILKNGSVQQLAQQIKNGNPVIIWGYYGSTQKNFSWQTPQGKAIQAVDGEHTRVVYGFDGPVSNPTRFYLIDPATGRFSWSTAELMNNWNSLNRMGVIVSPQSQWLREIGGTKIWEIDTDKNIRRWVTSWQTFTNRGGAAHLVVNTAKEKLLKYTVGSSIN